MDVERMAAERLMEATGVKAVLEVPDRRPDEFISVELVSGAGGRFVKSMTLAVQSWAATRRRAAEIAGAVAGAIPSLLDEENVFDAYDGGTYRWPDPDSNQERYQTAIVLTICE